MATATTLDREQQAIADLLTEFSNVSMRQGIGPCTLAAIVSRYAQAEEGVDRSIVRKMFEVASKQAEKDFLEYRARQDRLDAARG